MKRISHLLLMISNMKQADMLLKPLTTTYDNQSNENDFFADFLKLKEFKPSD